MRKIVFTSVESTWCILFKISSWKCDTWDSCSLLKKQILRCVDRLVFDLVAFAVEHVVSRTVNRLWTCEMV